MMTSNGKRNSDDGVAARPHLDRLSDDERAAFDELVRTRWEDVRRFFRLRLTDDHAADDATTQVFERLFLKHAKTDAPGERALWHTARQVYVDIIRTEARSRLPPTASATSVGDSSAGDPTDELLEFEIMREALQLLPRLEQQALLYRAMGLSYDEIGQRINTTRVLAADLVREARKELRRALVEEPSERAPVTELTRSGPTMRGPLAKRARQQLIERAEELLSPRADNVAERLAALRVRGRERAAQLLGEEGGPLSADQIAARLGVTIDAVEQRRVRGELLAVPVGGGEHQYPAWQLDGKDLLRGLVDVLADLRGHDAWMQLAFFLSRNPRLNGATPIQSLRAGDVAAVRRAARAYGDQGAA